MRKSISLLLVIGTLLFACTDNEAENEVQPSEKPVLPPAYSMAPDFSEFEDAEDGEGRVAAITNWTYAALNVSIYSKVLFSHLTVPMTAFKLALKQEATFDAESRLWVWEYDIEVPTRGFFHVKLTADVNESVNWKGYISKEGVFTDFVWFEGTSEAKGKSGSWVLYQNHDTPSAWLSSKWTASDDLSTATFTVEAEGEHKGSFINYEVTTSDLDRNVTISDTSTSNEIVVAWSSTTFEGRVKSEAHFGDNDYRCWDGKLQDTACD